MKAMFCLLLMMSALFVSVGIVGCDKVEETVSIKKTSKDFSGIESTIDEKDEWGVTRKRVTKKNNSLVGELDSIKADVLGIEDPERAIQQELLGKFEAYDQKRREEVLKPRCVIQECHGLDISCDFIKVGQMQICEDIYAMGDYCRIFVKCQEINGECVLIEDEDFEGCKECMVENKYKETPCRKEFPLKP